MENTLSSWKPKVTIVIPVYNGSDYLAQAIDSALAQTYTNVEIIVVNDGSTDDGKTDAIARSYGQRIRYFSKSNEGIAKTLNFGIEKMTGEYFSWLSHDDVFAPDKIFKQINLLQTLKNRDSLVYGDYNLINSKSEIFGERVIPHVEPERFYFLLFLDFPVHACTSLIPKKAFTKVGLFDADWKFLQDTDMWFRMAPHFPFIHIKEKMASVRMHPNQGTVTRSKQGYSEGNRMYADQMVKLKPSGIFLISGLTPYNFYLACAKSFCKKSYFRATASALDLAKTEAVGKKMSTIKIGLYRAFYTTLENLQIIKHRLFNRANN